jgi:hypothetical protein
MLTLSHAAVHCAWPAGSSRRQAIYLPAEMRVLLALNNT